MFKNRIFLLTAIVSQVVATFSLFGPSGVVVFGFRIAFYCLELTRRFIPTGDVVCSTWSGRSLRRIGLPLLLLALCGGAPVTWAAGLAAPAAALDAAQASKRSEESRMWMTVGERRFAITLAETEAARAFGRR